MGNSHPSDRTGAHDQAPAPALADVRDRALRATEVSFVITDATRPGCPIVWVNDGFTRTTGYTLDEAVGRNPSFLQGVQTDRSATDQLAQAVRTGSSATVTVLNYRRDGSPFWNQVSLSPVPDGDGAITHWVGIQVDVTEQVELTHSQARSIAEERRARNDLVLVSQVSDLLTDLEEPSALGAIATVLEQDLVSSADFFLLDDAGVLRAVPRDDVADSRTRPADPTPDGTTADGRRSGPEPGSGPADPVQQLLDGTIGGPIELDREDPGVGATTARLVASLRRTTEDEQARRVVVHALTGRRRALGVLVTVPRTGSGLAALDESDGTILKLVVRRTSLAVENVRLYRREHRLAETLQRAMLPEQAEVRGLDVWTYYAPSSAHAQVGGDWYDVLQVGPQVVALVIGDVVGHDVEAAAAMGQLRSVVRSYAYESSAPATVLDQVDRLVTGMRISRSASLVFATMERTATGWTLTYSRAGHLPPLVGRGRDVVQLSEAGSAMVGFGGGGRTDATYELLPGDVLILYTDGLIERRDRTLRDGVDALVEATRAVGVVDAAGVGEELLSRLAGDPEDDIAVVVVRVPDPDAVPDPSTPVPRRRRWSLPSEPASIGRARQAVLQSCSAWGIEGVPAAELVVSELVANAVLHGWGHVVLRLFDTGDGLRIEVEDSNPAPPVATEGHPGRVGGYGMRIVERLADWGWQPSESGKLVWANVRPVASGSGLSEPTPEPLQG